jgi:sodium-coupled neutral amino acid transporter 11
MADIHEIVDDTCGVGSVHEIVDETCGVGCVEIEQPPKPQISNLSRPKTKSQIGGACSNLVNSVVGAGIIGIPYALKETGLVAGVLLLVLVSYFTNKTLRMLVELASFHPQLRSIDVLSFEDLMSLPFGTAGGNFILASMLLVAYGSMVAYLLIIKDTVPIIMGVGNDPGEGGFMEREFVMMVTSLVIIVPLSMQRDMSSLAFTSALSCLADIVLVGIISFFSPYQESVANAGGLAEVIKGNWINYGFFIGFGVLTTAMTCQHSAFIVSGSLDRLTSKRWAIVSLISMTTACILCAILGIAGYLGFLEDTQGDVLNNFAYDTLEGTMARILLAFTMFFTYPMEAFVARHVIMKLLYDGDMDGGSAEEPSLLGSFFNRRVKWTWILYLTTLIPALIIDDLGPVLSITGSLGGCSLAYIAPGLVYLGINGDSFMEYVGYVLKKGHYDIGAMESSSPTISESAYASMDNVPSHDYASDGPKPWWWYPMLMPLWTWIATTGSQGMKQRLIALETEHGAQYLDSQDLPATETILPTKGDHYLSIFFIVFGVIAAVAGLVSNFIVQVI